jgi:hypothetical protein
MKECRIKLKLGPVRNCDGIYTYIYKYICIFMECLSFLLWWSVITHRYPKKSYFLSIQVQHTYYFTYFEHYCPPKQCRIDLILG